MKANEVTSKDLMVGDWLMFNGKPCQVKGLHNDDTATLTGYRSLYYLIDAEPIPLTPEILEKNGFEGIKEGRFPSLRNYYNDIIFQLEGIREEGNCKILYIFKNIPILYVHELQHALKLCRIDKEIVV